MIEWFTDLSIRIMVHNNVDSLVCMRLHIQKYGTSKKRSILHNSFALLQFLQCFLYCVLLNSDEYRKL